MGLLHLGDIKVDTGSLDYGSYRGSLKLRVLLWEYHMLGLLFRETAKQCILRP